MQEFIIEIINNYGYAGIFFLIAIENIFPPIPSEVILIFGGFVTVYTNMKVWGVVVSATLGAVAGAIFLYEIGRKFTTEKVERIFSRGIFKVFRLKKEDLSNARRWFDKYGSKAVLICRFIPFMRSIISVPAGMARMKMNIFLLLTVIGTFIWNTVLVFLGRLAGNAWDKVVLYMDYYSMTVGSLIFLILGLILVKKKLKI
ncbi:SNARE associated Golgi protein [Caldanaerovirga acetigignens]|uniref:SNARE associated Golgi protein n=1 Tax=Caldanaerovirga acetigignens TaxID=447595 RepID=A0A1M7L2B4_9FIRM|nr:DedA family protein [Caldanaerovirga acetigignens]SHM72045.1 SNARE associated Golgi protein [Caldanaerovirga acetigignens]